jgi:sulfate-transporting ATPase
LAFILTIIIDAALGVAIYWGIMRPLRGASPLARLIATLGVVIALEAAVVLIWGATTQFVKPLLYQHRWVIDGVSVLADRLILLAIGTVCAVVLWAGYRYTNLGLATVGASENPRAAAAVGYSPDMLATFNWALGGALSALAGMLVAPLIGLDPTTMTLLVIAALAAAAVGGFSSFPLTLAAGIVIGIIQSEMAEYVHTTGASDAVPFVIMVLVLTVRGRSLPLRSFLVDRLPTLGTGRIRWWAVIPLTVLACYLVDSVFPLPWNTAIVTSVTFAIVMLSLVVLSGYTGQVSLAPMAFAGLGALFAGQLVSRHWLPFELAMLVSVIGCAVVGLIFCIPALRTRGVNLAVVTVGLGLALNSAVFISFTLAGGDIGLQVGPQKFFGFAIDPLITPQRYAVFTIIFFVLAMLAVSNLRRSRTGRRLIAVRTNERAAEALGISVFGAKMYAFAVSAAIAGLGGVLIGFNGYAVTTGNGYDPLTSIQIVAYSVIGGIGYAIGPIFASPLVPGGIGSLLNNVIPGLNNYLLLVGGVVLVLLLLQDPNGAAHANVEAVKKIAPKLRWLGRYVPEPARNASSKLHVTSKASKVREYETATSPDAVVVAQAVPANLELNELTVRYGGVVAVDSASLSVRTGEIVGLIGPNGAGKTTLIDAVTGFAPIASGDLVLDGKPIKRWSAHRRTRANMSRTFQSLELFEDVTVRENLLAAADNRDFWSYLSSLFWPGKGRLDASTLAIVRTFGLQDHLDKHPTELSHGQRNLVAIARAVAVRPSILMLDEPAAGLDEHETEALGLLIRKLVTELGVGILLVEHDMSFVMGICDRIVVLDFGKLVATGTPSEVRASPIVRAAYLGDTLDSESAEAEIVAPMAGSAQ